MKKVTKSVIKLSEIPENLQRNKIFIGHKIHTYAIFHIDESEEDELSLWLIKNYPTIKRKTSFLIHIDKQLEDQNIFAYKEVFEKDELLSNLMLKSTKLSETDSYNRKIVRLDKLQELLTNEILNNTKNIQ
jgi:dsDNA-binding SOS-regulon protein